MLQPLPTLARDAAVYPRAASLSAVAVFRPLLLSLLATLALLWLARLGLALWQWQRVSDVQAWSHIVLQGLRFDAVLLGLLWVLPAALTPWMALHPRAWGAWLPVLRVLGAVAFVFVLFMELATPAFMAQYDSRPNYQFVEYLGYVKEVGRTLLVDYWPQLLFTAIALPLASRWYWRASGRASSVPTLRLWQAPLLSLLAFVVLAVCARGALGHRAANPAMAAVTSDHLVNELPLSSAYTVLYAVYLSRKSEDGGITYGQLSKERVLEIVRQTSGQPMAGFKDSQLPMRHLQTSTQPRKPPLNLVIVLQESMGAEFVGRLGGVGVTPNLDKLADEGIWFDQLYATGTRSVRGIEAVVAGYPPTSSVSTVKLAKSQRDFFTLATFLRGAGYESTFFYGGESHFDNMRSFFMGNGFDRVVEQKDMPADAFIATWGASDGDVFKAAHQHFSQQTPDQPFFGLVFTSSNHAPFEFPDGQIELHEQPKATVNNAVKYADHALGQFMAQAKASPYWNNTLFLIVADHNSRVYGPSLVPVERFHIPGLIMGGSVKKPQHIRTVASQIDLAPTLVSMMGLDGDNPWIGRDLSDSTQQALPGRAVMQFDKVQAYMQGRDVVLLQPHTAPQLMQYDGKTLLASSKQDPVLVETAIAHSLYAQWAYRDRWHR